MVIFKINSIKNALGFGFTKPGKQVNHIHTYIHTNDDTWVYPRSDEVLKEVGLFTIEHYIQKRRNTLSGYAENRDIYKHCVESEAKRGTGPLKKYYWQQLPLEDPDFDLNEFFEVM